MKLRPWAAGTALALATTFGGGAAFMAMDASPAAAARPAQAPVSTTVPCAIGADSSSTCTLTLTHLQVVDGVLQAAGTATGTYSSGLNAFTTSFTAPVVDPPACPILSLTLGPLNLNLLGLVVSIPNPVVLNVTAVPGAGNLLGNLLCAVTNLLNNTGSGAGLTGLLSNINALLAGL